MTVLLIIIASLLVLALTSLWHDLHGDGRGDHPIPRSRDDEAESRTSLLHRLA
ncbi:MAG: hypothetical protein H0V13_04395 [Nocardioidaceae bacterium]|jgi:hypothetical protein|nr:hypothetical protein [Nocardioidaceae bacterium]